MDVSFRYVAEDGLAPAEAPASLSHMDLTRVLIVDAQFLVADALAAALAAYDDLTMLDDRPTSGLGALKAASAGRPDVVLLDYWLPDMEGPAAIREVLEGIPETKVVTISWFHGPEQIKAALQAGAVGFLPKSVSVAKVAEGVRRAHQGEDPVFGEKVADLVETLRSRVDAMEQTVDRFANLTARELEIVQLLAMGLSVVTIARRMGITEATARTHITRVLHKTEAGSQLEAVTMARVAGLVP